MSVAAILLSDLGHSPHSPAPLTGVVTRLSERHELKWVAGERGKPGLNADINSATEAVREIADPFFEIQGTNATSALCTYYAEGGLTLTTATTSGDQMIPAPHLDANQSGWTGVTWGTDKSVEWEGHFSTAASIADVTIWAGLKLTNTSVTITDNDQAFFRYQDTVNSGKLQAIYSIAGTDTATDTGIAVAASTRYRVRVRIDSDRKATFFVNNELVATSTALTDAIDLIPYIGVQTGTSGAKVLYVHSESISRSIG